MTFLRFFCMALAFLCTQSAMADKPDPSKPAVIKNTDRFLLHPRTLRFIHDPDHSISAEAALRQFQSTNTNVKPAVGGGTYWVYTTIDNQSGSRDWHVAYTAVIASKMDAYLHTAGTLQALGTAPPEDQILANILSTPATIPAGKSALLLRLENDLFSMPPLYLTSAKKLSQWRSIAMVVAFVCLGVMLANLIISLFTLSALRSASVAVFSIYLLAHGSVLLSLNGFLLPWMAADFSARILTCAMMILATLFTWLFLQPAKPGRFASSILAFWGLVNFAYLISFLVGSDVLLSILLYRFITTLTLLSIVILCAYFGRRYRLAYLVCFAWAALIVSYIITVLGNVGVLDIPLRGTALTIGSTAEMLILSISIGISVVQLRRERIAALIDTQVARQEVKQKSEFVDTISHEIRTPLHALLGTVHRIKSQSLNPQVNKYVSELQYAGEALHGLTDNLLHYRLETNATPVSFAPEHIVHGVAQLFAERARDKGLSIQATCESAEVIGSPEAFRRILINLVSNAIKYTDDGVIRIECTSSPEQLRCSIADSGPGLSLQLIDQLNSTKNLSTTEFESVYSQSPSSGLGLQITQSLVAQSNGRIDFQNQKSGLHVEVQLPLFADAESAPKPHHVLVVDDLISSQAVATSYLEQLNCTAVAASSIEEALSILTADAGIDVLLVDHFLDQQDGFDLCRRLREHEDERLRQMRVVVMSAHSSDEFVDTLRALDCQYLPKPFSRNALSDAINGNSDRNNDRQLEGKGK